MKQFEDRPRQPQLVTSKFPQLSLTLSEEHPNMLHISVVWDGYHSISLHVFFCLVECEHKGLKIIDPVPTGN